MVKGKCDTGLKFDITVWSRFVFFKKGLTTVCLKAAGTIPELRQEFTKPRRLGPTVLKAVFNILEGTMSKGPFVGFKDCTMSPREDRETKSSWSKTAELVGATSKALSAFNVEFLLLSLLADSTLSTKKLRKFSHATIETSVTAEVHGFSTALIVSNHFRTMATAGNNIREVLIFRFSDGSLIVSKAIP